MISEIIYFVLAISEEVIFGTRCIAFIDGKGFNNTFGSNGK